MTEIEMYAMYGRKQAELDALNEQYNLLLGIFSKVASGEITLDRVSVDLGARSWSVTPAAPEPVAEPVAEVPSVQ